MKPPSQVLRVALARRRRRAREAQLATALPVGPQGPPAVLAESSEEEEPAELWGAQRALQGVEPRGAEPAELRVELAVVRVEPRERVDHLVLLLRALSMGA